MKHHLTITDELIYKHIWPGGNIMRYIVSIIIYTYGIICLKNDIFELAISILVNLRILTRIVQAILVKLRVDVSIY